MVNRVEFDKYSFIINGKRELIRAAAVHYFRLPGLTIWKDRLAKLKFAGYNTLDMYLNWGYHSEAPGQYDFTGIKDLDKLIDIANEYGFYITARPGPYINAEVSGGGFPGWLLGNKDAILRNRKNMDFVYSDEYMKHVREWYKEIIPIINRHDNIIAVQVENEYSTNEAEPDYMKELINLVRYLGCKLPIFHNDMYAVGFYQDLVDIYAIDNYSVTYFEKPWQSFPEVFAVLDGIEENLREYSPNSPMFIAELQAGWFDKWGGMGYDKMREMLGRQHIDIVTKTPLSHGVTVLTHYMGCGGTNWNNLGSTEVYTSYDFASPLTEYGLPTDRFYAARNINNFLKSFDLSHTELAQNQPEIKPLNPASTMVYRTRTSLKDNSRWLFLRNDSLGIASAIINGEYEATIDPQEMVILPSDLKFKDLTVKYSTIPFFAKIEDDKNQVIFPRTCISGEICLDIPENYKVELPKEASFIDIERNQNILIISYTKSKKHKSPLSIFIKGNNHNTRFIFLPECMIDYTYKIDNTLLVGPEYITTCNNNFVAASDKEQDFYTFYPEGKLTIANIPKPNSIEKINLMSWDRYKIGKEIDDNKEIDPDWKKVGTYLDADFNGFYEGYFWYKSIYNGMIDKLTLNARHCFAVYLNGNEIFSHDSFTSISGTDIDKPITINIPQEYQSDKNSLVLLIQSMGHNKGFEDDANNPRGLLDYHTQPDIHLDWYIKQAIDENILKIDALKYSDKEVKNDKLECAVTKFNFSLDESHQVPLGIVFNNPPFNKANIYLNEILIGHYWRDKGPQNKFYLPESFYYQDGRSNSIKLVIWHRSIDKNKNYTRRLSDVNIYIEPYGVYRLTDLEELK